MLEALFGWWEYDFMRRAFFAVLLIMPLFSLLGPGGEQRHGLLFRRPWATPP